MGPKNTQLYRSRDNRRIAGVCGGLAKVLEIDARLLRWIFILTAEVTAVIYLLLWIYLDEEPVEAPSSTLKRSAYTVQ